MQLIRSVGRELRFDDNHSGRRIEPWRDLFDRLYDRRSDRVDRRVDLRSDRRELCEFG